MVFQTQGVPGIHSDKPEGTYDKDKCQKKTSQTDQLCNSSQFLGALQRKQLLKVAIWPNWLDLPIHPPGIR